MNPLPHANDNKRRQTLAHENARRVVKRQKVILDGGLARPNPDGWKDTGGCVFFTESPVISIERLSGNGNWRTRVAPVWICVRVLVSIDRVMTEQDTRQEKLSEGREAA